MTEAIDFDTAIDQALKASQSNLAAVEHVRKLTIQLNHAVSRKTNGRVVIQLWSKHGNVTGHDELIELVNTWKDNAQYASELAVRISVVAISLPQSPETRKTLWDVEFSDEGYPVTLYGPEYDASVTCTGEDDVTKAFLEAAGHAVVGRKLEFLMPERQGKASPST